MGTFSNTNYSKTIDSLVQGSQKRLDNPYYIFSDKKPTTVTYYNINIKKTTLDQGSRTTYDHVGENSPLRFNKIENFQLYGIEKIQIDYNVDEYGVSSPIEGEALILPNTVIPCVEDMFYINYLLDKPILFRVSKVTIDTLDTGANFYRIQYFMDRVDKTALKYLNNKQLINTYVYRPGNVGSNFVALIAKEDSELIDKLGSMMDTLRMYYQNLFFRNNIQTFVYQYNDMYVYDPYLIEFLIRTKLFAVEDSKYYMYISQAVHRDETFAIEYDHTIFKDIEDRNPELHRNSCYPVPVHDPNSLLVDRMEDYFQLSINLMHKPYENPINWIDMKLFDAITDNILYDEEDPSAPIYRNIIIGWINDKEYMVNDKEFKSLQEIPFNHCKEFFYEIPIIIYIISRIINSIQANTSNDPATDSGSSRSTTEGISTTNQLAEDHRNQIEERGYKIDGELIETADDNYLSGR